MNEKQNNSESNYVLLKKLEEKIRQFLEQELSELSSQWWKQRIPGDVKENAEKRKEKDEQRKNWNYTKQPLISYIDFTDYEKVITQKNNWEDVFQHIFRDKPAISSKLKEIDPIRNAISHTRNLDVYEVKQIKFYSEEILRSISYYIVNKSKTNFEKIKITKPILSTPLTVSFDRSVYPINSTVHLRANIPKLITNEALIFQIFNNKKKIIFERKISFSDIPAKELDPGVGIYEISFTMNEDWKVGEEYVLKGKYGTFEICSQTRVDAREPVIQSDKSVYIIGDDIILTVIDPDADKDSDVAEFVGDKEDSKVIIESKYGKIDGYRLRETGDSTGIFQGIIGILGIRKNGTVIPQNFNGKNIDKIQGTGIDDGFIGGRPGDEITISYKNRTRIVSLSIFILDFGATVEMDKKVYKSNDMVYLTVVAPDFSFDSDIVNEIGQKPESMIQIQTSADKLDYYKLVETGTDTGIFTGEIQLAPIDKKSPDQPNTRRGPTEGILGCNEKEDFIKVVFTLFEDKSVVGKAVIRS